MKKKFLISAIVLLYIFSNSFILDEFARNWETKALDTREMQQPYEYGIVLGGLASYDISLKRVNFSQSSDRLLQAIQLLKTGKIKKILISGGVATFSGEGLKESEYLREYLLSIGITDSLIAIESQSRNTHENAVNTAKLLQTKRLQGKLLLITSGYHLPRAIGCFKKAGLQVTAYSTERYSGPRKFQFDHCFIPSTDTLRKWDFILHEWAGYLMYKMMNYL